MRAVEKTSEGGWNSIVLLGDERMSERESKDDAVWCSRVERAGQWARRGRI